MRLSANRTVIFTHLHTHVLPTGSDTLVAVLFALQMMVAYCLMLIIMIYDVCIFTAVIVGLCTGECFRECGCGVYKPFRRVQLHGGGDID